MERKDKLIIFGIILVLMLNIAILIIVSKYYTNMPLTGFATKEKATATSTALIIKGNLLENKGLKKCCTTSEDEACYVAKNSACTECLEICKNT